MKGPVRAVAGLAALVLVLAGLLLARRVLVPFLLAAVVAYVLEPVVAWLEARGLRRTWGIAVVISGIALLVVVIVATIVPEVISQVRRFSERLPGYAQALQERLLPLETFLREKYPDQVQAASEQALGAARGILPAVMGWMAAAIKGALGGAANLVVWLVTIVIVPVFAYYLLVDHREIRDRIEALVPEDGRAQVREKVAAIDRVLRAWLKSQLAVAAVLALIYAAGLTLLGVPLGLLIGAVGGLANMVPFMGLVVGLLPAVLLSFLDTGSWVTPLMVVGLFAFGQVLEGMVISPRIVGGGLGMPPALVLLSVLVGGELFGFTGLLLAVPATAAGLVLLQGARPSSATRAAPSGRERLPLQRPRPRG